ncbi:hypothetical protein ETAA8_68220 [Anatilimnocola aggregata]|uniref:DUF1501 domain-containing protein n=1 Tax=Anatilimnocola aggregata TaxID=2528021 RepID=A0A517YN75_9BACT|nr:DUF1501 domain-containing protein [Anatilimnocola aggregata]QDU31662.1 hypothetical protein ETAA8_68220 [Anatilimnocola aggregata]
MQIIPTETSRRSFLEAFAKTFFGVNVLGLSISASAIERRKPPAQSVVYLYLRGGISHIDTFDPKPGRAEMGGVTAIDTSAAGVQVSEWFPKFARQMHHVSLVRSMTSTQGVHDRGNYLAHTSYYLTPTIAHPALGTWALKQLGSANPLLPGNILINGSPQHPGSGYMESHLAPLPIVDPASGLQNSALRRGETALDFVRRTQLAKSLGHSFLERTQLRSVAAYDKIHAKAVDLMKSKDLKAFDITQESAQTQEAYGSHTFGKGCLLARRLVEHGVRFIEVEDDQNWDTHNDQLVSMQRMTPSADQTLAALLSDLHQRGLLETTLVVMATEFGRTPQISEVTAGRGHHPAVFTWWVAGGGMKGGYVYGKSDAAGDRVAEHPVNMPDFNATIAHAMGIDVEKIEHSPSGRPFTVADKGKIIEDLFA